MATITEYHRQLTEAGVRWSAPGRLQPTQGWRIASAAGRKIVTDGPSPRPGSLIAGLTIIGVPSREQAVEWAARFPNRR